MAAESSTMTAPSGARSGAISPRSARSARYAAIAVAALVLVQIIATPFTGAGLDRLPGVQGSYVPVGDLIVDGCIVAIALVVIWARPGNPIGWLMLTFALLGATQNFTEAYGVRAQAEPGSQLPLGPLALSLGTSLWIPAVALPATLLLNLYPDGRVAAPFWSWVNRVTVVAMIVVTVAAGTSLSVVRQDFKAARPAVAMPQAAGTALVVAGAVVLLGCALVSIGGAVWRTWRARAPQRQQLLLLLVTSAIVVLLTPLNAPAWLYDVGLVAIPAAVAVGVLRYRLLGVEVVIRRTLQFAVLTLLVVAVYAAATAAMSALVSDGTGSRVVAAAAVALVLLPLRDRLQAWVDRLVYGARRDPLGAIRRVGASVSAVSADPLPAVVGSVADAVRASFVAIIDADGAVLAAVGTEPVAKAGAEAGPRLAYPLTVAGQQVGRLVIYPARGESTVAAADARVITALVDPVAAIVHATQLTRRLAAAHEQTLAAHEQTLAAHERALAAAQQERSRIRRDLHDGLGPSLSGVALGLEAAQAALPDDTQTVATLTARMRTEIVGAVEDVRRIIDELRPAALEDVGLVQALRERAASLAARSASGLIIQVRAAEPMPGLPERVEIAAFRIAEEAMTNVVRHARASRCEVRLEVGDALVLSVSDDGIGLPGQPRPDGIGLTSIRQRAADLGGHCMVGSGEPTGVIVEARLPLEVT
jgi:signal transduction histidine kinase